jgi:octaprenyl-diphosphate synthase
MNINDVFSLVKEDIDAVEKNLIENLDSEVEMVNKVASYVFESGGKRMRPVFLNLTSRLFGYSGERAIILSGVVEYIHTATLLHDDVIDGAKYRRGRKSANNVFGNDITVLCGDFLYSRAFVNLVKDGDSEIQMILANAAKTMSEGEVFQLVKTAQFNLDINDYIKIINSKTAVLFSSCCEIGAILGEASEEQQKAVRDFGTITGQAFQISDDILDYMGDPEVTGKKPGTDLNEGKMTLPVILLREMVTDIEKKKLHNIIVEEEFSEENLQVVLELMEKYEIRKHSEKYVDKLVNKSKELLELLPDNEYRKALSYLSEYMIKRDK